MGDKADGTVEIQWTLQSRRTRGFVLSDWQNSLVCDNSQEIVQSLLNLVNLKAGIQNGIEYRVVRNRKETMTVTTTTETLFVIE